MGLDMSHDCWHGSYSAFFRWRNEIASAGGYAVWRVVGEDRVERDTVMLDWGHVTDAQLAGKWGKDRPVDPLLVLLIHSDCDGELPVWALGDLADRLETLLPRLPKGEAGGHIGNWHDKTQTFIDGLRRAAKAGKPVVFS